MSHLLSAPIAHRGLWSPNGPPENSLSAFASAIDEGYGVELDVRLSSDDVAMVFHDRHLARMASAAADLREKTSVELAALRLKGGREPIPSLAEALDVVAGRTATLVEVKSEPGEEGPLEERVAQALGAYSGPAAVIGFNPASHAWFAERRPGILRGLNLDLKRPGALDRPALDQMIALAQPDFLLPSVEDLDARALSALKDVGAPLVVWTVRSPTAWASVSEHCATLIFEGWRP